MQQSQCPVIKSLYHDQCSTSCSSHYYHKAFRRRTVCWAPFHHDSMKTAVAIRSSPGRLRAYSWCSRVGQILAGSFPSLPACAAHAEPAPYSQCSTLTVCNAGPQSCVPASLAEELRRAVVALLLASEALSCCEDAQSCSCPADTVCFCMSATSRALSCASFTSTPAASTPPALLQLLASGAVDSAGSGLLPLPFATLRSPPLFSSAEDMPAGQDGLCAAGAGGSGEIAMGCRQAWSRRAASAGRPGRRASSASPTTTSRSAHASAPMSSARPAPLGSPCPSTDCPRCQSLHHAQSHFLHLLDQDPASDSTLRTYIAAKHVVKNMQNG